jgi:hypothetical protein
MFFLPCFARETGRELYLYGEVEVDRGAGMNFTYDGAEEEQNVSDGAHSGD